MGITRNAPQLHKYISSLCAKIRPKGLLVMYSASQEGAGQEDASPSVPSRWYSMYSVSILTQSGPLTVSSCGPTSQLYRESRPLPSFLSELSCFSFTGLLPGVALIHSKRKVAACSEPISIRRITESRRQTEAAVLAAT